jgi:hypothetical protein
VACAVAAPLAIGVARKALRIAGFARTGIAAGTFLLTMFSHVVLTVAIGSVAAAYQSGVGNVVAGSTFATLQSAGAGGAGAAIVNGIAAGTATAVAAASTVPGLIRAAMEDEDMTVDKEEHSSEVTEEEREKSLLELQEGEEQIFAVGEEDEDVDDEVKKEQ